MPEHVLLVEQDLSSYTPSCDGTSRISKSAEERFKDSVKLCAKNPNGFLRMCVAFWTHKPSHIAIQILKREKSTICADIHKPTDIDKLDALVGRGVKNVFLFLYRNREKNYQQTPLLHSKIFLFDFGDGSAEIWMGSQNFTRSALSGINCESIHILKTTVDSKIYSEVDKYIDFIKQCCEDVQGQFDREKKEFYKELQQIRIKSNPLYVLDVLGTRSSFSTGDSIILIVDSASNDQNEFKARTYEAILRVLSSEQKLIQYDIVIEVTAITTSEGLKELGRRKKPSHAHVGYIIRTHSRIPLLRELNNDIQKILSDIDEIASEIGLIAIIKIVKINERDLSSGHSEVWGDLESKDSYHYAESLPTDSSRQNLQIPKQSIRPKVTDFDRLIDCELNVIEQNISKLERYYDSVLEALKQKLSSYASKNMKNEMVPEPRLMKQEKLLRKMHYFENQDDNVHEIKPKSNETPQKKLL